MNAQFVSRLAHAYIDYPVSFALIVLPLLLGLGSSSSLAFWIAFAAGLVSFSMALLTDHETGLFRLLPYTLHLFADLIVGIVLAVAPFVFNFTGIDAIFYWVGAAVFLTIVFLKQPACACCDGSSVEQKTTEMGWNEFSSQN